MARKAETDIGTLYIVATPIGNLEDITFRAVRIPKEVDLIAAEDTRHTRKLLNHLGINTRLVSYYREKEHERGAELIERMREGESVALVSDAGTPAVSDPGAILVRLAHEAGIKVTPVPGPSALTAAISAAGFTQKGFLFLGFAPVKPAQRKKFLTSLGNVQYPVVFYEAPRRVSDLLADALETLGDRPAFIAREITKSFEELRLSRLAELSAKDADIKEKGEFVVIIGPSEAGAKPEGQNLEELLVWYRDNSEMSLKDVCRILADDLGLSRSKIYQQALSVWKDKN